MIITPEHRIVIAGDAAAAVRTAARELREHLRQIAGLDLPVLEAGEGARHSLALQELGSPLRPASGARGDVEPPLEAEEYRLRVHDNCLTLAGGSPRGLLYGVYGLLRDHLGCRWFTPDCAVAPRRDTVDLEPLDARCAPAYEYRNFILAGVDDPAWCARNGYNGFNSPDNPAYGGHTAHWQYGHSLFALCPPETYFKEHPEYFDSTSRGKKVVDDYINLCFTNDAVVRIVADNMRKVMADAAAKQRTDPDTTQPTIFYLAQHDGGTTCTCPGCRRIIKDQDALSAPLIHFCNRIVEEIGDEFPAFRMMTIAYRFSRRPPRSLRPHPRLIVQLCSIECCQSHPYPTCDDPFDGLFRRDLEGWRALTDSLWVWDYMPRLWHPFLIGPGFEAMAANYRWFHERGVRGMFTQTGGERDFKRMNAYLMCQMMRDPHQEWASLRDEFMAAYYGPAAAPLREFLRTVQDRVVGGNHHLHYKEGTVKPFFSDAVIRAGDRLFSAAAEAVRHDDQRAERVREEFMHFLCTKLQHGCRDSVTNRCAIRKGRYVFSRPESMRRDADTFSAWKHSRFGGGQPGGYTRGRGESCTLHVESDLITLDNGTLELEFLPRLAGRMVGLRHRHTGHNLLHMAPCEGGRFNLENGYREEWLAAPGPYEQESASGWSRSQGASAGAAEAAHAASVAAGATQPGQIFETGGKFMHPLQWERWTRLDGSGGGLHIESMVVNRGALPVKAPVETLLPLDLGNLAEVVLHTPAGQGSRDGAAGETSRPRQCDPPTGSRIAACTLDPAAAAVGIVLSSRLLGLALRWRATGEVIEAVAIEPDGGLGRVTIRVRTRPEVLPPGAGRRFCQYFDVVALRSGSL